jgi:hypothetical protein
MSSPSIAREIFTIVRRAPDWAVEHAGIDLDSFKTKEEAMASATRRANASQNSGKPAQIRFADEPSFTRG